MLPSPKPRAARLLRGAAARARAMAHRKRVCKRRGHPPWHIDPSGRPGALLWRTADKDRSDCQGATLDRGRRRREASRLRIGSPGDRGLCPLTVSTPLLAPCTLCALVLTYLGLNLAISQWSTACATRNDAAGSRRGFTTEWMA